MTRRDFMAELTRRLAALPEGERRDALQYYEEYFDDAGPEMEGAVLAELKSPAAVAARLGGWSGALAEKDDPGQQFADQGQRAAEQRQQIPGRQSDAGKSSTVEQSDQSPLHTGQRQYAEPPFSRWEVGQKEWQRAASEPEPVETRSGGFWVAMILLSPIWAPLLLAVVIVLGALVFSAAAVIFALGLTVLALIACCVLCLVVGVGQTFTDPLNGLFTLSWGLTGAGLALLLFPGVRWLTVRGIPVMGRWMGRTVQAMTRPLRKKEG